PVRAGGLALVPPDEAPEGDVFLLGVDGDGVAYFAVHVDGQHPDPEAATLRDAGPWLSDVDGALMAHACATASWHAAHRPCSARDAVHRRRCRRRGMSGNAPSTGRSTILGRIRS